MQKTALVTGANRGLGLAISNLLAERDFHVFMTGRVDGINADEPIVKSRHASYLIMDVTHPYQLHWTKRNVEKATDRLDLLVNNAAIKLDGHPDASICEMFTSELVTTLKTNTLGVIQVIQTFWPLLKAARGRVINISSTDALCRDHHRPAYAISKAALNAVTKKFAIAGLEDGITVNAVCPGHFRSGMGGENAPRSAAEAAADLIWLATSEDAGTGHFYSGREILG